MKLGDTLKNSPVEVGDVLLVEEGGVLDQRSFPEGADDPLGGGGLDLGDGPGQKRRVAEQENALLQSDCVERPEKKEEHFGVRSLPFPPEQLRADLERLHREAGFLRARVHPVRIADSQRALLGRVVRREVRDGRQRDVSAKTARLAVGRVHRDEFLTEERRQPLPGGLEELKPRREERTVPPLLEERQKDSFALLHRRRKIAPDVGAASGKAVHGFILLVYDVIVDSSL